MEQVYVKIFTGSSIEVLGIKSCLEAVNIIPVIKDESESARLAGFGAPLEMLQVFVHKDELAVAQKALAAING
ncbi:MAG: putative signal transducing protein [Flavobacteriaceae bacterium]